jgi:hypothetical protein
MPCWYPQCAGEFICEHCGGCTAHCDCQESEFDDDEMGKDPEDEEET